MNKAGNTNREVATFGNTSKGTGYTREDSIFINDGTPGGTVKLESQVVGNSNYELSKITNTYNGNTVVKATNKVTGEIYSFKNFGNTQAGNSLSITNMSTSLVPLNPNVAKGVTVTAPSSARTVTGSVVPNLITSGKSVTTLEVPKNPVVKPFIKPKQDIETVKKPATTSLEKFEAERADSGNKKEINTELHQKISNREEGHYLNLQADKKVENITTSYKNFDHIAKGEIIVKGDKVKVTGGHSTRGGIIVEEKIQEFPGGAYEAKIKVPDPNNPGKYLEKTNNGGKATMFPDNWTENRIKVEIDNVLKNPNNQVGDYKWQGTTSTGVKIEVIYREGKVITAYPIKP